MDDSIKKTICDKAWNYPIINFSNNEVSQCCHAVHQKVKEEDIDSYGKDIFTKFKPLVDAKTDILNGVQTPNCSYCWYIENKGMRSSRHSEEKTKKYFNEVGVNLNNLDDAQKNKIVNISKPRLIELSLGNTCDLKCMYCNNIFSSQWAVENIKYGELDKDYFDKASNPVVTAKMEAAWWDWFDNDNVHNEANSIGFIGGEPLIIDKTYDYIHKILDKCRTRTQLWPVTISIVTNLNTPEIYFNKFLDLIPHIINNRNVVLDLSVSIEALTTRAEFIRTGLKWDRFEKNIKTVLEIVKQHKDRINFSFMIALNSLCISDLPNFFKWVVMLQNDYNVPINLRGNQVVYPNWLSPTILPQSYASYITESKKILSAEKIDYSLYKYGEWPLYLEHLDEVLKGIQEPIKSELTRRSFVENINVLCKRRNLNFKNVFPEMIEFYQECNNINE